jgi:hypothetical protein
MEHEEEDQIRFQKEKEILHIFTVSTLYGLYLCVEIEVHIFTVSTLYGLYLCVEIEVQCQCLKSCLNEPI